MTWLTKLKEMKSNAALTYNEISEKSGVPYSTVEKLFNGRTQDPKLIMIHKLVSCMGGSMDSLFHNDESGESSEELELIEMLNSLDVRGRELVYELIRHEYDRVSSERSAIPKQRSSLIFYDFPVSAGTGEFMDVANGTVISVDDTPPSGTDYLLRIAGSSMEPEFHNGDIVYVQSTEYIDFGEIGIFSYAGNVYIKEYTERGLKSLNPAYPIIAASEDIKCLGRVLGKLSGKIYTD